MAAGTEAISRSAAMRSQPAPGAGRRRALTVAVWVLQILLVLQLVMAGLLKIGGSPAMVDMFNTIGAGQWLRYVVGALELAGAAGLLIPRLRGVAALGLATLLLGATVTNLVILHTSPAFPAGLCVVSALITWARWDDTWSMLRTRSVSARSSRFSAAREP
jgi:putative oxidoreductase